jgi:hypothetical protein
MRYTHNQKMRNQNNVNVLRSMKTTGLNMISKLGYGPLCLREENLTFENI